jgi:hypothetical protein
MVLLLVLFSFGVVCWVGAVVSDHIGAKANGMIVNSYMVEREGRYFAVDRGMEQRVLREITPQEFKSRTQYKRFSRVLAAVGIVLMMTSGISFVGIRLASLRR